MYRTNNALSFDFIFFSEMLKFPSVKVESHFLKKLAFVINKCLAQHAFGKFPRTTENLSKHTAVSEYSFAQAFLFFRIFYKT